MKIVSIQNLIHHISSVSCIPMSNISQYIVYNFS